MCGLAGRVLPEPGPVGTDLVRLLAAQRHRGADSTGFALYGLPAPGRHVVRLMLEPAAPVGVTLDRIEASLREHGGDLLGEPTVVEGLSAHVHVRLEVTPPGSVGAWMATSESIAGVTVQSVGEALEIIKDIGDADAVAERHGVHEFVGTHGIGHARMASETAVSPLAAHPFWARGLPDVAVVHNGQLTNHHGLRRRLLRTGHGFHSDTDSEILTAWLADHVGRGGTVPEALEASSVALDGVFTFLVSTGSGVGLAKDPWAIRPLFELAGADGTTLATEEQALRHVHDDETVAIAHEGPSVLKTWTAGVSVLEPA